MHALVFGAGNIGRGFLGQLLAASGWSVTFIDVDEGKIALLNRASEYPVRIVSKAGVDETTVRGVRGITLADAAAVAEAIVESELILTAVGKNALAAVAQHLARGLLARSRRRGSADLHVIVIACENVLGNTALLRDLIRADVPEEYHETLLDRVSFPNCVVDRIVPTVASGPADNPLAVDVERYFQFAVDLNALRGPFPDLPWMQLTTDLGSIVDQKLSTLNMAHAIVGYYGYLRGCRYIHEAMEEPSIRDLLAGALDEVELGLTRTHASISIDDQRRYAASVIERFQNPYLRDEVTRVARQPLRKLGPDDRLVRPARLAMQFGKTPAYLATGITAALHYDYADDTEARELVERVRERGIAHVLRDVSDVEPESDLGRLVRADHHFRNL